MATTKSAYELSQSQVSTPEEIVKLFWKLTHQKRAQLGSVLDAGCGDGRFSRYGKFQRYMGVEIDERRARTATRPPNGRIVNECAFQHRGTNYDACVGNPPYVRHNYIESDWKAAVLKRIQSELGIKLGGNSNLYLYFVCLGLLKTNARLLR